MDRDTCCVKPRIGILAASCVLAMAGFCSAQSITFKEVTAEVGLKDPLVGIMGHGGAWGDYDGDGKVDLVVGGFCDRPNEEYAPAKSPVPLRLFRHQDGRFKVVDEPPVSFFARTSGAVFADLDNNGTLELYVANNTRSRSRRTIQPQQSAQLRHSSLLEYRDGRWRDISESSHACPPALLSARNVMPLDYDSDGLLDLLVVEDRFGGRGQPPMTTLLRNQGDLKFKVANDAGIPDDAFALGAAIADINEDGRPDIFLAHSNRWFLSDGRGGYRESESLSKQFAWTPVDGEDWPCGAAFGDLNRDGRLDLVLSIHHVKARNRVYLNEGVHNGVPKFRDITKQAGLDSIVPVRCPHVEIQDFDNDGFMDIYMSAAWLENGEVTPLIWRHTGLGQHTPRFEPPRAIPATDEKMVYFPAGPTADYDGDGRRDLLLINWFQGNHTRLLKNTSKKTNHWLDVRVTGDATLNRMGIGAKVHVYKSGKAGDPNALLGFQEVATGYGYASGQPAECHFGLGANDQVDLVVTFTPFKQKTLRNVPANQVLIVKEP